MQLEIILFQESGCRTFSSKINDRYWSRFPLPGMIFFLLSKSNIQLDTCWLLPRYKCHYFTFKVILSCWNLWFVDKWSKQHYQLLSSLGSLYCTFQLCVSQFSERRHFYQIPLESSDPCVQSTCYLQQQGFTLFNWKVTKDNSYIQILF